MSQIIWITEGQARAIHSKQLALFGGANGILDEGKLSSALARPKHLYTYNQQANPYELAASLGWGLVKNHHESRRQQTNCLCGHGCVFKGQWD